MRPLLLTALIYLGGCTPQPQISHRPDDSLNYFKDTFGNCYATWNPGSYGGMLASIPCKSVGL